MPFIDPSWWDTAQIQGRLMRDVLAVHDIDVLFAFLSHRGWSRAALAAATGLSETRVREVARGGGRVTSYEVLVRIAVGLRIPRGYMGLACSPDDGDMAPSRRDVAPRVPVADEGFNRGSARTGYELGGSDPRAFLRVRFGVHGDALNAHVLAVIDNIRRGTDHVLAAGTVSPARMDAFEESVADRRREYTRRAPLPMLRDLARDLMDVGEVSVQRQTTWIQSRLCIVTAQLAVLVADALMRLGAVRDARAWYRTACVAADDSHEPRTRAFARAQAAMLPYYFGDLRETVQLAREAQSIASSIPCSATALA